MSRIIPIPTTRVGDLFIRQRLADQVLTDQLALFRLQNQVTTGRRLQLPSDDAPAALRAINLQRLLDRKAQIQTNIQASNTQLSAAESTIALVSQQLSDLRGAVLEVSGTLASDQQRQAVIQQIDQTISFLVDTANSESRGQYLFAGSKTGTQPYKTNGNFVEYVGNESNLRSYVDLDRLFDMNVPGNEVFGGVSEAVAGTADLNPHLTTDTLLSTINGGAGIGRNAAIAMTVSVATSAHTSVVDLGGATTIGDIARRIEAGAPAGATVTVDVTGRGLTVRTASGTIAISEVAEGSAAKELGILTSSSTPPSGAIVGSELNPVVLKTTRLANLLGTKAQGRLVSANSNNDILLTAAQNGEAFNGVTVEFVGGGTVGSENATYNSGTKTLTVQIQVGFSTARQVAAAITAEGTFTAAADYRDATSTARAGANAVEVANFGVVTSGGSGQVLDTTSGLILTNGDTSVALDVGEAETVEDLLNLMNGSELGLLAEINASATGINVRSRLSGADLTIGENGGTTATQLGIRTYTGATELADFNRGVGVPVSETNAEDIRILARDGTELLLDLSTSSFTAKTVQDVIDLINNHPSNNTGTTAVTARLAATGNGIELIDASTATTGPLIVESVEGSQAAEYLGFVPSGESQVSTSVPDVGGNYVLGSEDRHTLETDSVFNTLVRLRTALQEGDIPEIGRSLERLDTDRNRVNFARAEIGARLQDLDVINIHLEDEDVLLRAALSDDMDVDLVEAISNLTARQYAYEASLRTAGSLLQLSLLNFI
jgi:flagellar hook-associated protein 3 FlgL